MEREKFHGRVHGRATPCAVRGCDRLGEFRAPNPYAALGGPDGPGEWQWLCLDHVRAFNARYDFFDGMSRDEIEAAQTPIAGWARETRAFAQSGVDSPPKWADFADPLEAISGRFRTTQRGAAAATRFTAAERAAFKTLGLEEDADSTALRQKYSALVRQYHPDRNGGDRRFEKKLSAVVEAYQLLRASPQLGKR